MRPNVDRVSAAARAAGLEISVTRFPEGTRTAEDAARAITPVDLVRASGGGVVELAEPPAA